MLSKTRQSQADRLLAKLSSLSGFPVEAITSKSRKRQLVALRVVATWVLYKNGWTFKEVGQALGGRDHSTALNSNREMNDWIYLDSLNRATDEQRDAVQMAMIANRFYLSNVSPSPSTQMDKIKRASEMAASGSSLYSVLGACC